MKKFSLLLLSTLMALCVFTSCSDDDNDHAIVGKWKLVKESYEVTTTNEEVKKLLEEYLNDDDPSDDYTLEFSADGKVYNEDGISAPYKINGNTITVGGAYNTRFSISNNSLTLYHEMDEEEYEWYTTESFLKNILKIENPGTVVIDGIVEKEHFVRM